MSVESGRCARLRITNHNAIPAKTSVAAVTAHQATRFRPASVGQVLNTSAQQSRQYGYLSWISGLDTVSTQTGTPVSEANALFTFNNDTATQQVINSGPVRMIRRTGTCTIYFNESGGATFANPDTFKSGKEVQVSTLQHQVVIDTSTGYFTASFELTVTSAPTFQLGGKINRLGKRGEVYQWNVYGKLSPQSPPSAYIAGFATGPDVEMIDE